MATPEQLANAAKLTETQEAYNEHLEKAKKLREDLAELNLGDGDTAEKLAKLEKQKTEALEEQTKLQQEQLRTQRALRDAQRELLNEQENMGNIVGALNDVQRKAVINKQIAVASARKALDTAQDNLKTQRESIRELDKKKKIAQQNLDLEKKYGKEVVKNLEEAEKGNQRLFSAQSKVAKQIPGIGDKLGKALDMKTKALNFSTDIGKLGKAMGPDSALGKGLSKVSGKMTKFVKGIGMGPLVIVAMVAQLVSMAMEVNALSKQLGAATGFGDKFNGSLIRMAKSGNMAGISFKESAAALKSLADGLSSFNPNAEETNEYVGLTVARLEKLGVSSAATVKSMDHMQRAMGLTAKQAADTTAQVARLGKEIGITGTKAINDFVAASGRLAIYGKQNSKVFKELAAQAKATGIEMGGLLNISSKFDKFDTAAESVAQLNAVLGTQLSTIEMINASDSEKIMLMKQEVQAQVGNFDALDKHTKQYIAHAMGVKDVAEAQRLLNMSTAEYQKYMDGQKESTDIQQEMAEATEKLVPIMHQLKMAALEIFMAFSPIIMVLAQFLRFISPAIAFIAKLTAAVAPLLVLLYSLFQALVGILATIVGAATPVGWIVAAFVALLVVLSQLYNLFKKKINPDFAQIFNFLADSLVGMLSPLKFVTAGVKKITGAFTGLFKSAKKDSANMTKDGFDIKAMATMDTAKISAGIKDIKSAVMELSSVKIDGFLAMTTDGTSSSFVMGSDGLIKSISEGKLVVDVKMPDMQMPDISVKVYIGDRELRDIIRTETKAVMGRAG